MAHSASTRRIFLIGFMGAGKTSVGRALARRLGWTFRDLDDVIESAQGKTVARIFAEAGEAAFRNMESAALSVILRNELMESDPGMVLALGGGAFAQPENREALTRAGGVTILLEAPIEELQRRCAGQAVIRPLAADPERFAELYLSRRRAYDLAPLRVQNVNKTIEEAAAEIESLIDPVVRR